MEGGGYLNSHETQVLAAQVLSSFTQANKKLQCSGICVGAKLTLTVLRRETMHHSGFLPDSWLDSISVDYRHRICCLPGGSRSSYFASAAVIGADVALRIFAVPSSVWSDTASLSLQQNQTYCHNARTYHVGRPAGVWLRV